MSNDPSQQRHLEKEKPFCSQVFAKSITALTLPNYVHLLQNPSHHGLEKISLPLPTPSCLTLAWPWLTPLRSSKPRWDPPPPPPPQSPDQECWCLHRERERAYWGGDDLAMAPIRNLKWILICLATVTRHLGTIWIASMNTFLECQLYRRCSSPLWTAFIPMQGCINGKLISRKYQHRSGWQLLETK